MYAKIFRQIFDSSIADNYELRHFFMDMLVLADRDGVVNMTHNAIAATTRIPVENVKRLIAFLEAPDPQSQTAAFEGRRIKLLDDHRSWGWLVLNYERFREISNDMERKEATRSRVKKLRESSQLLDSQACNGMSQNVTKSHVCVSESASASVSQEGGTGGRFVKPTLEQMKEHGQKMELPETEVEKCFNYYESNGWRVGRNPMKLWTAAMSNWKRNWMDRGGHINGNRHTNGTSQGNAVTQRIGLEKERERLLQELKDKTPQYDFDDTPELRKRRREIKQLLMQIDGKLGELALA